VEPPPADLTARLGRPGSYQPGSYQPGRSGPAARPPARRRGLAVTLIVAGVILALALAGLALKLKRRDDAGTSGATTPPVSAPVAAPSSGAASSPAGAVALGPAQVVQKYYRLLNEHRYLAAWELGGRNGGSGSYGTYVAGYTGTASSRVQILSVSGDVVTARLTATQDNGVVKVYQGTYTVQASEITHFNVIRTA
jgi:hypothetical protein